MRSRKRMISFNPSKQMKGRCSKLNKRITQIILALTTRCSSAMKSKLVSKSPKISMLRMGTRANLQLEDSSLRETVHSHSISLATSIKMKSILELSMVYGKQEISLILMMASLLIWSKYLKKLNPLFSISKLTMQDPTRARTK